MEIQRSVDSKVETSRRRNNLAACQSTFPLKKVPDRKSFSVYPAAVTRAILTKPPPLRRGERGTSSRRKGGHCVTTGMKRVPLFDPQTL